MLLSCGFVLTGFGRHSVPKPTPTPTPTPRPTPTAPANPAVVVYPFTVTGDLPSDAGAKLGVIIGQQMIAQGGVVVKPAPVVVRANYEGEATKLGADYYISGYITPVGDSISMVEQVVSTSSGGVIVFSKTAQIQSYNDAATQAIALHDAILTHAGRLDAQYSQQAAPAATPTPNTTNGTSTNLSNLGSIFKRRSHVAPGTPAPRPPRAMIVVRVTGSAVQALRTKASELLLQSLSQRYTASFSALVSSNVRADLKSICGAQSSPSVGSGILSQDSVRRGFRNVTEDTFTLRVYNCDGSMIYQTATRGESLETTISAAVDKYIALHPNNS
ncbi:MAG: hypothetical protein M3Y21_10485 [Candidatus Eremiobacteraeota bacterium]|nr:hypothetical protein [Candidatus Eremiobacteraeota bacterium]